MKRKKWSELEEHALLTKYSELLTSGTLSKLKTREKKFKPIADHVNSVHHLQDPINYPFKWSWRDVSIKIQNMRHQYLGVKQKIRVSDGEFNWKDGENHWENFLKYKEVFGDVELEVKDNRVANGGDCGDADFFEGNRGFEANGDDRYGLGLGFGIDSEDLEEDGEVREEGGDGGSCGEFGEERAENEILGSVPVRKMKRRRLNLIGAQVLELRDMVVRREERRREREFAREEGSAIKEERRREKERLKQRQQWYSEVAVERRESEVEEMHILLARREFNRLLRLEKELEEERWWRMKREEKREEEEMEWRERLVAMQIEHEKQMMQMHANACQNQLQILGLMARFVCQFFGSASDGLGPGLGALPPQVLQNLHHTGGLGDNGKPDANSPSEFL
ncbi:hypothetical protein Nepgr_006186 [Nepenthes gracilis]|uniref:Stress response protein NST1-like n=1 Tax=Nepenthes gracilis TaxID=150966 RepID=A0AAD3XH47_NEPGR|nr:hypothetical protein Nepgr_006186 [Nepenthes gracilis]